MNPRTLLFLGLVAMLTPSCGGGGGGGGGGATVVPAAPAGVAAVGDVTQATITWLPVAGAASYNIYRSTVPGITKANYLGLAGGTLIASAASPHVDSGLSTGVAYYFIVTAVNGAGESVESSEVSATTNAFVPGLLFLGDKETAGVKEMYVADLQGTVLAKRSGAMAGAGNVIGGALADYEWGRGLFWSLDNRYIAYLADQDTLGIVELYVVPSGGGPPVKVSMPGLAAGRNVASALWSADSQYLAFTADEITDNVPELYVVKRDGTGRVKVSGTLAPGSGGVGHFRWAPVGLKLAYLAQQDSATLYELYTVSQDGSNGLKVSQVLPGNPITNSGFSYGWAPDGTRIGYVAAQHMAGVGELYTVKPDGTQNVRVNTAIVVGTVTPDFQTPMNVWSADSSRIAYVVSGAGPVELHVGNADGSGSVKVSDTTPVGGSVTMKQWAPDGSRIAYIANQDTLAVRELYTVLPNGTGRLKVSAPVVPGGTIGGSNPFFWFDDSLRIVYWGGAATVGVSELFVCTPDVAGSGIKVSGTLAAGNVSNAVSISDMSKIAFTAQGDTAGVTEGYVVSRNGGPRTKVTPALGAGGAIFEFKGANSNRMILGVRLTAGAKGEYYTVNLDGTGLVKVSGAPPVGNLAEVIPSWW